MHYLCLPNVKLVVYNQYAIANPRVWRISSFQYLPRNEVFVAVFVTMESKEFTDLRRIGQESHVVISAEIKTRQTGISKLTIFKLIEFSIFDSILRLLYSAKAKFGKLSED